jgi:hypothetical protein
MDAPTTLRKWRTDPKAFSPETLNYKLAKSPQSIVSQGFVAQPPLPKQIKLPRCRTRPEEATLPVISGGMEAGEQ